MKRGVLLVLGIVFLGLWVIGLFDPNRTFSIHAALIVAVIFFLRSLMALPNATATKNTVANEPPRVLREESVT